MLIIVMLLGVHSSYGQSIRFQFKRVNACTQLGQIDSTLYYLKDEKDSAYESKDGTVLLPGPGKYKICMWSEPETNFPPIEITSQPLVTYVYNEPKIEVRAYGMHPVMVYETCGKPIDGYLEDFYPNGKCRIRGNFKQGKPKDSLVTFYANGVVKKRKRYLPNEMLIEEYDSLNNITKVSHNSNRSYYLTDYSTVEYYSNGRIKLKESSKNRLVTIEEYYPGGQLKTIQTKKYRTEYFENGKISVACKWKRKRVKEGKGEHSFTYNVHRTAFDSTGDKLTSIVYEYWHMRLPLPFFDLDRSDWIDTWTKYENGKATIIAESIATDAFLKTNAAH